MHSEGYGQPQSWQKYERHHYDFLGGRKGNEKKRMYLVTRESKQKDWNIKKV